MGSERDGDDDENATRAVASFVPALAHLRGDMGNESDDSDEEFFDLL